jgi:hypothetical protein
VNTEAFVGWSDDQDGWVWSVRRGSELIASGCEPFESDAWTHACYALEHEQRIAA